MSSSKIFLLRHGKTDWNAIGKLAGHSNEAMLTHEGKKQAQQAGEVLKDILTENAKIHLCSSTLTRAQETAEIIASHIGYPKEQIQKHENLKEMNWGTLGGVVLQKGESIYSHLPQEPSSLEEKFFTPIDFAQGESYHSVGKRALEVIEKIYVDFSDHHIIIICHGGVIKSVYGLLTKNYELPNVGNCGGLIIEGNLFTSPSITPFSL